MSKHFRIMQPDSHKDRTYMAVKGIKPIFHIDWALIAPHEGQAIMNHGQGLATLHSRGGLSACEAVAVLEDRPWRQMTLDAAYKRLAELRGDNP